MDTTTAALTRQIKVPFYGTELYVADCHGQPYTPMKPIVEGMGLDWGGQHKKLAANQDRWGVSVMEIPSVGGAQEALCLPLRKLGGWLMTVHASRVRTEIRDRIVQYQDECDDVLWHYWNQGIVANSSKGRIGSARSTLTDRADALRSATELVIDRHVPYSAAYKVLQLYAGTLSFRAMTCDQANNAADFGRRLLSHLDTPNDWRQIAQNREDLVGGHVQLPLAGLVHARLGPTDD